MSNERFQKQLYAGENKRLYATEFGRSHVDYDTVVGPRIRSDYLMHYIEEGTCCFCGVQLCAGDVFFIAKGKVHTFEITACYKHRWIGFDGTSVGEVLGEFNIPIDKHLTFHVRYPNFLLKMLEDAYEEETADGSAAIAVLRAMISLLDMGNNAEADPLAIAAMFFKNNYSNKITVAQAAERAYLSEKYFCRRFKEVYGMSPGRYLRRVRMEQAAKILKTTNLKINAIAESVGYMSQFEFSAAFTKYYGMSPTAYRNFPLKKL